MLNKMLAGGVNPVENPLFGPYLKSALSTSDPSSFFNVIIPNFIGLLFVIGVIIFFFMILLGAIGWMSSGGDKTALESARGKISSAIIGIVILFSTFAFLKLIEVFFGINILTIDIGPLIIE